MVAKNGSTAESPPSSSVHPEGHPGSSSELSATAAFGGEIQIKDMSNHELASYLEDRDVEYEFIDAVVKSRLTGSAFARMLGCHATIDLAEQTLRPEETGTRH